MDRLLTFDETAARLGVHVATLRAWVREGRVPAYRLGRRFARLNWAEVLRALSADKAIDRESAERPEDAVQGA